MKKTQKKANMAKSGRLGEGLSRAGREKKKKRETWRTKPFLSVISPDSQDGNLAGTICMGRLRAGKITSSFHPVQHRVIVSISSGFVQVHPCPFSPLPSLPSSLHSFPECFTNMGASTSRASSVETVELEEEDSLHSVSPGFLPQFKLRIFKPLIFFVPFLMGSPDHLSILSKFIPAAPRSLNSMRIWRDGPQLPLSLQGWCRLSSSARPTSPSTGKWRRREITLVKEG